MACQEPGTSPPQIFAGPTQRQSRGSWLDLGLPSSGCLFLLPFLELATFHLGVP